MSRTLLVALVLLSTVAMAQQQPTAPAGGRQFSTNLVQREEAPSYSDLYCAGFLTNEGISKTNLIAGGINTPAETQFTRGTEVFVSGGGLQEGQQYSVLRELHDPNRYPAFTGARAAVDAAGQPYAELGRIRVTAIRGGTAVADIEFSCQNMTVGDIVVPFREHPQVSYRKDTNFQRFPAGAARLSGRIVMAREFDQEVGRGQKVYLDIGSGKGVKPGDYFRVVRGYDPAKMNPVDNLPYSSPVGEDTQKYPGTVTKDEAKNLPIRSLGEIIILNVTPSSATGMITNSLENIEVGDYVELEEAQQ